MSFYIFCIENSSRTNWHYRAWDDSLNQLLDKCYDDDHSVRKSDYSASFVQNASLPSCVTGVQASGEIYRLSPVALLSDTVAEAKASIKLPARSREYFNRNGSLAILFFINLLFSACGYQKNLTGRYKTLSRAPLAAFQDSVKVKGYVLEVPASKPAASIRAINLSSEAQVRLIRELGDDVNDGEKLLKLLGTPIITTSAEEPALVNRTRFKKRLVFSVRNKNPRPENRISKLEVTLNAPAGVVEFTGCDKVATDYQGIDVGKLTFKNNVSGEFSAGGEIGPTASLEKNYKEATPNGKEGYDTAVLKAIVATSAKANAAAKLAFSRELYEEANVKQRYVALSASVNGTEVSFYQESVAGIDLSGTIISDVEFEVPRAHQMTVNSFKFTLKDNAGTLLSPNAVTYKKVYEIYPQPAYRTVDIRLGLNYSGVFRRVLQGGKTMIEGDDEVELMEGGSTITDSITLLRTWELTPHRWFLQFANGDQLKIGRTIGSAPASLVDIYFQDYFSAKVLLDWIQQAVIGAGTAALPVQPMTNEKIYFFVGSTLLSDGSKHALEINLQ